MSELGGNHPGRRLHALRLMCRLLDDDAAVPTCSDRDLADVIAIASEERLSAATALALTRHSLMERVDEPRAQQLRWARRHTALTQHRFAQQLADALTSLEKAAIPTVVVKGGALMVDVAPQQISPGDREALTVREMSDIDLLVAPTDHDRAIETLVASGYRRVELAEVTALEPDHATTMVAPNLPGPLDLHRALGMTAAAAVLPVPDVMSRAVPATMGTAHCLVLAPADALAYAVWHAQMQDANYRFRILPTRQLHSFALLLRAVGIEHWAAVRERYDAAGLSDVLDAHVEQLRYLFGVDLGPTRSPGRARRHRASCLASFALAGVADARRNITNAFAPDYLQVRYGAVPLRTARARHLWALITHRRRVTASDAFRSAGR